MIQKKVSEPKYPKLKEQDLSDSIKAEIRDRIKSGSTDIYELAQEFGCSPSQIAGIKAALTKLGG